MKSDWNPESDDVNRDQVAAYDEMRTRCPVAYNESRSWSVFRHADVMQILGDHDTFSNAVSQHLSVPNGMEPPEHGKYRQIIEPYFGPDRMNTFEPVCRDIAKELLIQVASEATAGKLEVMGELATRFALRIQCAFLGWPSELHDTLVRWADNHHDATRRVDREALSRLTRELEAIVDDLIEQRIQTKAQPDEDLTASLMHETFKHRTLSNEEISSILRNWTVGEIGTISASIGILIHHLAKHLDHQETLRSQLAMLPTAIDEILRVHNPLHGNRRKTTCPVKLGDRQLAADERVYINWISANRDEAVFEDAGTVKLDRNSDKNLLYGAGIHVCPGAPLARMEMQVFMDEFFAKTELVTLDPTASAIQASYPVSGLVSVPVHFEFAN